MKRKLQTGLLIRRRLQYCLALLIFCVVLVLSALIFRDKFFAVYTPWSRFVSGLLGFIVSFAPFSLAEFMLYILISFALAYLIISVVLAVTRAGERGMYMKSCLVTLLAIVSTGVTVFLLVWGLQYHAPRVETQLGLELREHYTQQELIDTAVWLQGIINETAPLAQRNADGVMEVPFKELAHASARAVEQLGADHPIFKAALVSPAKRITAYPLMDYTYIAGIYSPFTGEANVNPNTASALLPFSMTHEMAHRLGYAAEQDANFVAFLACMASDDPGIRYSGARGVYGYCVRHIESYEMLMTLSNNMTPYYNLDTLQAIEKVAYMDEDVVKITAPISEKTNDTYLKVNGQAEGTGSYGRVAELVIAWRLAQG